MLSSQHGRARTRWARFFSDARTRLPGHICWLNFRISDLIWFHVYFSFSGRSRRSWVAAWPAFFSCSCFVRLPTTGTRRISSAMLPWQRCAAPHSAARPANVVEGAKGPRAAGAAYFCLAPPLPEHGRYQERQTASIVGSAQVAAGLRSWVSLRLRRVRAAARRPGYGTTVSVSRR